MGGLEYMAIEDIILPYIQDSRKRIRFFLGILFNQFFNYICFSGLKKATVCLK